MKYFPELKKLKLEEEADVRSLFKFLDPADIAWYEQVFESCRSGEVLIEEEENQALESYLNRVKAKRV